MKKQYLQVMKQELLISEKIKESFDPKRIVNPGKMYRGDLMQTNFSKHN